VSSSDPFEPQVIVALDTRSKGLQNPAECCPPESTTPRFIRRGAGVCPWRTFPNERNTEMGISVSLILIAVGAILTWAVTATVSGLDLNVVGVILMIVGAAGLILSMLFWSSWGGFHATRTDTTIVRDDALPR
jgi:Domain of unknown function (DUF6458)